MTSPKVAKPAPAAPPAPRITLKGDGMTKQVFSDNVQNDPLFVTARKGSGMVAAYALEGKTHEYRRLGYSYVDPKNIEVMDFGQEFPDTKDFGVYVDVDKNATTHGIGEHVLMWTYAAEKEARQKREMAMSAATRSIGKLQERAEGQNFSIERNEELEEETTIGKFMAPES